MALPDLAREQQLAAARAVDEVRGGMLLGLGTGRTAAFAVQALATRLREGLVIEAATATSNATQALAAGLDVPLVPFERLSRLDLTIDGADEIDGRLRAIKGGGGALVREKIVATASDRVIIIGDSSKPVERLGRVKLPVEVLPFAGAFVERRLGAFGGRVELRAGEGGAPYATDQGNRIYDLHLGAIDDPAALAAALDTIPGVIGHGLFLDEIDALVIARGETVSMIERPRSDIG